MDPNILQNLRDARDLLTSKTGVRARLIGDPDDRRTTTERPTVLQKIARHDNLVYFRVAHHSSRAAMNQSATLHIKQLSDLVAECLDAILTGQPRVLVRITFDGYEQDPRELYEIDEVRRWMHKVFVEHVPQAIALLDPMTFHVAQTTCNRIVRSVKTVGPTGSPARAAFEVSPEWQIACYLAGIDARAEATNPFPRT